MEAPIKRCLVCGNEYPATTEYFHCHGKTQALYPHCKSCRNARQRAKYVNDDYHKQRTTRYRNAHPEKMREAARRWHERNPGYRVPDANRKNRERMRAWRANNHERSREADRRAKARKTPQQKRRDNEMSRKRYHSNPVYRERMREYRRNHPEKEKSIQQRRRARKRNLPNTFTAQDWKAALNYWHGCCAYCGNPPGLFNSMRICADHFIPITDSNCPGTVPENIVPACKACNSSKHDKPPEQWVKGMFGKKAKQILSRIFTYFAQLQPPGE